jgi:hypothetical protein
VNPLTYEMVFHRSGASSCSCPDFQTRGGACKHLRAMRRIIDTWVVAGHETSFNYISSRSAVIEHFKSLKSDHLPVPALTHPAIPSVLPPTPAWDLSVIQALGEDNTTVDDCEPGAVSEDSVRMESGESSGTDGDDAGPHDCHEADSLHNTGSLGHKDFLVRFTHRFIHPIFLQANSSPNDLDIQYFAACSDSGSSSAKNRLYSPASPTTFTRSCFPPFGS